MPPPVFLLHGLLSAPEVLAGLFGEATGATGHSFPGHGGRPPTGEAGLDAFAADLAEGVERCGRPAVLVGWSMGASVALTLAATRPELVAGLVLTGATPCLRAWADFPHALAPAQLDRLAAGLVADFAGTCKAFCTAMAGRDRDARDRLLAATLEADPDFALATLKACAAADLRGLLDRVTAPATVIAARDDATTPFAAQAWLAEAVGGRLITLEAGGHAAFLTRPDLFGPALRRAVPDAFGG